ncbi:MAG: aspartate/glutamate racemase family protein [Solirubrobacterales bacterium]|nr:aspartate/glutamate racemase family protein [Solirubrobacterales bacterium]MBV9472338.1 aspartate/glutamate racemase family protein [Solirubrobacterales bacterium]
MPVRVGLLVPSSNTVAEVDFYRRLPSMATLHTARMFLEEVTPEHESAMLDRHLSAAVKDIATLSPDVVVFACTSAGALRGNASEAELLARIAAQTGAETIGVAAAVRRAIAARRAERVGVITPYVESLNDKIRAALEADGLRVAAIDGLGIRANSEIAAVEPERIVRLAAECFERAEFELLFVSCTNFRALDARERIERTLQIPVVTSNQAALEAALDHIGATTPA